jgi:hypothetical protein
MIRASLFLNIAIRHNASIAQIKGSNRSGVRHSLASFYSSVAAEDSEVSSTKNESKTAIKNQQPNKNFVWNSDKNNVKQESKANNQRKNPWNKFRKGRAMPAENKIVNSLKQDHEGKGRNDYMNKNNSDNHNNYERRTDTRNAVFESKESPNSKDTTSKNDNWQTLNKSNEKTLKRPEQTSRTSGEYNGIEKLREAFMQTLSIDRQRRQANVEQKTPSGHGGTYPHFLVRLRIIREISAIFKIRRNLGWISCFKCQKGSLLYINPTHADSSNRISGSILLNNASNKHKGDSSVRMDL